MAKKRGFRRALRALLILDEPPERTARTYGFGVFLGFSPLIGFHTIIAVLIMLVARVNRLALLLGVYTNTPWTIAPALALGYGIGVVLTGHRGSIPELTVDGLSTGAFWKMLTADAWNLLVPFMIGNFILAAACGFLAYFVLLRFLVRYRKSRKRKRA